MVGVDLITAALAAGAAAGVSDVASGALRDSYEGLRTLLRRRLSGQAEAQKTLDAVETEPGWWQAEIGADLTASGAAGDAEILDAARRVLTLARENSKYRVNVWNSQGVSTGDHNTFNMTFGRLEDPPAPAS